MQFNRTDKAFLANPGISLAYHVVLIVLRRLLPFFGDETEIQR